MSHIGKISRIYRSKIRASLKATPLLLTSKQNKSLSEIYEGFDTTFYFDIVVNCPPKGNWSLNAWECKHSQLLYKVVLTMHIKAKEQPIFFGG